MDVCDMCAAAVSLKRSAADDAPLAGVLKPAKIAKKAPVVDSAVPSRRGLLLGKHPVDRPRPKDGPTTPAVRPMDALLDVVGTARGDRGRRCEEHKCCGGDVLAEDVVVRFRRQQILVPNKLGKGTHKETAYTVNWVTDGQDRCRVGFLPRAYVVQGHLFDGVLAQVVAVGNEFDDDPNERAKVRHACGYARVQVISPLNNGH